MKSNKLETSLRDVLSGRIIIGETHEGVERLMGILTPFNYKILAVPPDSEGPCLFELLND